jgi:DNA-3-methyladenine glycosylase I
MLEGFQAGLSWSTILKKRDNFFAAFEGWDPVRVAGYDQAEFDRLMADAGIVRNRLKVNASMQNARAFLELQQAEGSFDAYLAAFESTIPVRPRPAQVSDVPSKTAQSDWLSKDLKKRGFTFVGSTICYAFMQSVGVVDDHLATCWRAIESA